MIILLYGFLGKEFGLDNIIYSQNLARGFERNGWKVIPGEESCRYGVVAWFKIAADQQGMVYENDICAVRMLPAGKKVFKHGYLYHQAGFFQAFTFSGSGRIFSCIDKTCREGP